MTTTTTTTTSTSTTSKGKTRSGSDMNFPFIFRIDSPRGGDDTFEFEDAEGREGKKTASVSVSAMKERTSPFAASTSPSLQPCKTYRWINNTILCYAFRCDIIFPVKFDDFVLLRFLPSLAFRCLLFLPHLAEIQTTGEPVIGRRTYGGFSRRERQGGREKKEGWLTEIHDENFFFRGFCGKNTVTQWHARKEVRYLKRPGIFPSSQSAIHDADFVSHSLVRAALARRQLHYKNTIVN